MGGAIDFVMHSQQLFKAALASEEVVMMYLEITSREGDCLPQWFLMSTKKQSHTDLHLGV